MRLVLVLALFWVPVAGADLYRWVDPDSGSVKFSSYPPPWYGDPAKARRAPKVVVIPSGRAAPAPPATPAGLPADAAVPPASVPGSLEAQRRALLQRVPALASQATTESGAQALAKHIESFKGVSDEIDRLDPSGAAARKSELQDLVRKSLPRIPQ